jgi:hypothetical protein
VVRLYHADLKESTGLKFTVRRSVPRVSYGEWFLIDDGELLIAERLDAWRLPLALQAQSKRDPALAARLATEKLAGSPAPELSGNTWLNTAKPASWNDLHGKPVLLVLFDLKQPSFVPLAAPLLAFQEMYRSQGLAIVGVHADGPREDIEKRLAAEKHKKGFAGCGLVDSQRESPPGKRGIRSEQKLA